MCGLQRYWYYIYDRDYHAKECGVPFSLGYYDIATLSPRERCRLYTVVLAAIGKMLCSRTLEGVKLGPTGFGDFLAEARVGRLKGIFYNNNEMFG
jgi:hypothetical protein